MAGGYVGVGQRERFVDRRDRREVVVGLAVEQLLLDQRARRYEPHDVAANQTIGLRNLELLRERHDEALRDEPREIPRERVMRHPGHRHALTRTGLFAGERDLQRARDRLGVLAVRFVEIADAREQDRFGVLGLHPEVLLEHGREFGHGRAL